MKYVSVFLSLLVYGFFGVGIDGKSVFLMEGDSVTLNNDVKTNHQDRSNWYFQYSTIAEVTGDLSKICEESHIYPWFRRNRLCKITEMPVSRTFGREERMTICPSYLSDSYRDIQCNYYTESFRDRLKLDHQSGSLTIMNTRTTDSGDYHHISSSRRQIFSVTVHGVPVAERDQMKRRSLKQGESVTLDPGVIKTPNDVMAWYFNDILIAEITGDQSKIVADDHYDGRLRNGLKLNDQTGSLTITNTRTTHSGDYKLHINSRRFSIIRSFSVTVTGLSGVDKDEVSVMKGDSVTLHTGVKTNQQETIKWYFNDIRIVQISLDESKICTDVQCKDGDERFRGRLKLDKRTGSLTIMNTSTTDAGLYKLQIINSRISIMKRFSVTVASSSGVGTDEVSAYVTEGDSVILNTNVKTNLQEKIKWFFNDTRIAQINGDLKTCTDVQCNKGAERFRDRLKLDHQTGSLTIMNTSTTDSGLYQLEIISERIGIMKPFSVFVHGVPAAERDEMRRKSVMEGESVTFDPGEIKNPNDFLTWYFNILIAEITGDQSKICTDDQCDERFRHRTKLDHQTGSLTITIMRTSDSGLYKLTITKIRFSIIKSFIVAVTAAVIGIYAVAAAAVVVLLLVVLAAAVIYHHKRQRRRREIVMQSSHQNRAEDLYSNQTEDQPINETSSNQSETHAANETSQ